MVQLDYGVEINGTSIRNPQANAILERVHQTIGNIIRTFELHDSEEENPWDGILAATMFATRATYHTTLEATPSQLVFGRDAILNTKLEADWIYKQQVLIEAAEAAYSWARSRGIAKEQRKRIPHQYQVGDQVLVKNPEVKTKFAGPEYKGPFTIRAVHDNGTVRVQMDKTLDTFNIRQIKPYKN